MNKFLWNNLEILFHKKELSNMPTACLYIRVSTDEQAIRGCSQRSQQDRLTKFCLTHNVDVLNYIFEDHPAKTFDRPAWSAMMTGFKRNKLMRQTCFCSRSGTGSVAILGMLIT